MNWLRRSTVSPGVGLSTTNAVMPWGFPSCLGTVAITIITLATDPFVIQSFRPLST